MQAICKLCGEIVFGPEVAVKLDLSGAEPFGIPGAPVLTPAEVREILEWHKLGQTMFEHVMRRHPESAGPSLQAVTACTGYLFSQFFTGGAEFDRMREVARASALAHLGAEEPAKGDSGPN